MVATLNLAPTSSITGWVTTRPVIFSASRLIPGRALSGADGFCHRLKVASVSPLFRPVHGVAHPKHVRRYRCLATVNGNVAVEDDLASLGSRLGEAKAVDYIVQTQLQNPHQVLAADAVAAHRLSVVALELALQDAVDGTGPLLLAELEAAVRHFFGDAGNAGQGDKTDAQRSTWE